MTDLASKSSSWADAEDDLPTTSIINNPDGTKTIISYKLNNEGQKVKITQTIKETTVTETVHPKIALRKKWRKFGAERNSAPGPDFSTTQIGEPVDLHLGVGWKESEKAEEAAKAQESAKTGHSTITCRLCGGAHFTSKCPYKDTLGTDESIITPAGAATPEPEKSNVYIPSHKRKDASGVSKYEDRDDSTTLRVTQLNESVTEDDLRNELFAKYGPLVRVTLVKNRETGRSKGLAYVVFATENSAQRALDELNGRGYKSLILQLDWSKSRKT